MLTPKQISKLIKALQSEEIVIMPTDTIYSLSAKQSSANQIRINHLKKSPADKLLITLVSSKQQLSQMVEEAVISKHFHLLDQGLTLVLPQRGHRKKTIAVRLIKHPDLVKILASTGPLWSTSVNLSGERWLNDLEEIKTRFPQIKTFSSNEVLKSSPSRIYDPIKEKWLR